MAALLAGRLPRPGYVRLLQSLHTLYAALETALDANGHQPWLAGVDREALRRTPALAADLAGEALAEPAPPARAYALRLQSLAAVGAPALLAHVYTRYLGDLHGGQVLQRLVARQYAGIGTRFYGFGPEAQVLALRQGLRAALGAAPLSAAEADAVVAEARWSFEQHIVLFEALGTG